MFDILIMVLGYVAMFGFGYVIFFFGGLGGSVAMWFTGIFIMFLSGFSAAYQNLPKVLDVSQPLLSIDIMGASASMSINFAISVIIGIVVAVLGYGYIFWRK